MLATVGGGREATDQEHAWQTSAPGPTTFPSRGSPPRPPSAPTAPASETHCTAAVETGDGRPQRVRGGGVNGPARGDDDQSPDAGAAGRGAGGGGSCHGIAGGAKYRADHGRDVLQWCVLSPIRL